MIIKAPQTIDLKVEYNVTQSKNVNRQEKYSTIKIPKYHWIRDKVDIRDYKYAIKTSTPVINVVDLRNYCTPIENQGNLGSCTGNAIAGAIELLNKRNNKQNDISRLFIYYYERLIEGTVNYDNGAYIRNGIKACYTYGAPIENLWPYLINKFATKPASTAISDAAKRKITLYQRVANFTGCIDALTNGYPVIVGFNVYSSFESVSTRRTGIMTYPDTKKERLLGGHCVLLVGYDKTRQVFIARNSWGTNWGDNGYFYMPFKVIQDTMMSRDFWVINSVRNP